MCCHLFYLVLIQNRSLLRFKIRIYKNCTSSHHQPCVGTHSCKLLTTPTRNLDWSPLQIPQNLIYFTYSSRIYLSNDSTTCFISTNDSTRFNQNNEIERTRVYFSSFEKYVDASNGGKNDKIDAPFKLGYLEDKNLAPLT